MHPDDVNEQTKEGLKYELIGQSGRVERRMVTDGQPITAELDSAIIARFSAWRKANPNPADARKLRSNDDIAAEISASPQRQIKGTTLSEVLNGKYKGDRDAQLRKIAAFLDDEEEKADRVEFVRHARISLTEKIWGTIRSAVKHNRMAAIIGESGWGKTNAALAYEREYPGSIYVRTLKPDSNDRDVSDLVCAAIPELQPSRARPHRQRNNDILEWLSQHKRVVFFNDEAQFNGPAAMEQWRTYHDMADPSQNRGLPIIFLGDQNFLNRIVEAKGGKSKAMAPQIARRLLYVFNIDTEAVGRNNPGGDVLSVEDILAIVHRGRVRLVTPGAERWLAKLCNTPRGGHLGQMLDTLRVAIDIATQLGETLVNEDHLWMALEKSCGAQLANAINGLSGGKLARKVA